MTPAASERRYRTVSNRLTLLVFGLAFCIGTLPLAAQQNAPDQRQDQDQGQMTGAPQDAQPPQGQPDAPPPPPDAQPPSQPQDQPQNQPAGPPPPPYSQPSQDQQGPQAQGQPPANQPAPPPTITVPAGTIVRVRVDEWISSDRNVIGDNVSAVLEQPLVVNGWVIARRGQAETGRVSTVKKGGFGGTSQLGLELPMLTLVDGQQVPLETKLYQVSGGRTGTTGRDVATVGGTTGFGAIVGGIVGGGTGAAIGAGLGATAGVIGVMSTKGRPTTIPPETVVSFRLESPITISTENSRYAFRPVTQSDYDSRPSQQQPRPRPIRPMPPPPYGPYPYAYGYPYPWYPTPFVGFGYYRGW